MSQHLYPCQCCGVHGVAHYYTVHLGGQDYVNILLCTGCQRAGCGPMCFPCSANPTLRVPCQQRKAAV